MNLFNRFKTLFIFSLSLLINSSQLLYCQEPNKNSSEFTNILDQVNNTDLERLFVYLVIVIILVSVSLFIIYKFFSIICAKIEGINLGKLSIKFRKKDKIIANNSAKTNEIDFNSLLGIFELIMKVELKSIVNEVVSSTNDIHTIESEYDKNVKIIFDKNFSSIERDLHDKLVQMACESTNFNLNNIKNTREYFFISDLLNEYKTVWIESAKGITRRNGFVDFLKDKSKAEPYISELIQIFDQCIDMGKLESTSLKKSDIDEIVTESYKSFYIILEKMFLNLASLKETMLEKRKYKLNYINNSITETSEKIISEIRDNVLKTIICDEDTNTIEVEEKK